MAGHNGYGATTGGKLPRPSFRIAANPGGKSFVEAAMMLARFAKATKSDRVEALDWLRREKKIECNDEQASAILEIAKGLRV